MMTITRTRYAASLAAAFLVGALTLPILAAPGARRGNPESAWKAGDESSERGPRHGDRGPEGRGDRGPGGPGGPAGMIPGLDGGKALFPFWENERLTENLNLTDEQVTSLEESHKIVRDALEAGKGTAREKAKALRDELAKDNPDLAAANTLLDEITADISAKGRIVLGHVVTVKTILTPEQEETLKANAPGAARDRMEDLGGLRDEIREIMMGGGSIDDVKALLTEKEIPAEAQERIIEHIEKRHAEKTGNKTK